VDLCGHATLAAAHVLYEHENYTGKQIVFHTIYRGSLIVTREKDLLTMNFPADMPEKTELTDDLLACFHQSPIAAFKGVSNYMLMFENESEILALGPDFHAIAKLPATGVIATARGDDSDFVSRFFSPQSGISEDPVTGSAHTTLTPYWSTELGKKELTAIQLSSRKGYLYCKMMGNRVGISGKARTYLTGEIVVE
jgi:PhzF family phenazine biosynthesis protein